MTRYEILARFANVPKMKFVPLFRDRRTYKNEKSAKETIRKQRDFRPDLDFKVTPVVIHHCPECCQEIKEKVRA